MKEEFNIDIENPEEFFRKNKSKPFIEIPGENIWSLGYDTKPYVDFEETENFPNCCNYHKNELKNVEDWFEEFPNCCDTHKALLNKKWFNKDKYLHVPIKILNQFQYTTNFINNKIDDDDWFKEITDYIDYTYQSFGTPAIGLDRFYFILINWIKQQKGNKKNLNRIKRLIVFLESKNDVKNNKTDLNKLYATFQRWLASLPNLPFFKNYKLRLKNKFPLKDILHSPEYNKYTGLTKFKCKTHNELLELLIQTTRQLLLSINTSELLKNNHISSIEKHQIDIANGQHIIKQNQLLVEYSKTEIKYVKIIKKWLKNEKEYLNEIKEVFSSNTYLKSEKFTLEENFENSVFISYSWENEESNSQIISFSVFLRSKGINCVIDRYLSQKEASIDFSKMMNDSIKYSKKVIIILTKSYKEKTNNPKSGVGIEYQLIMNQINLEKNKFILVSFSGISDEIIPDGFKNREIIDLSKKENNNILFSKLLDDPIIDFGKVSKEKVKVEKKCFPDFKQEELPTTPYKINC